MAISTEDQTKLLKVVAGLFNAAPGATFLPDLEAFIDSGGTHKNLARELAGNPIFTDGVMGSATTSAEQAAILAGNFGLTADSVDGSPATLAITFFTNGIAEGTDIGDLVWEAVLFLADADLAPEFAPTALLLDNKAAVSAAYSAAKGSSSLTDLQASLSGVTGDAVLTEAEIAALVDAAPGTPVVDPGLTLTEIAANAAYAEILLPADATAGEIATAAALTLTTAEAAIADGATQAEIDAELAILIEEGADDVAAAEAAAIRAQIVALSEANTAVSEFLATLDDDADINTSDDDISTTTAEQTIHYDATVTDYEAVVTVSQADVANDTDVSAAAKLSLQEDANAVTLTTAELAVTTATTALTAVPGLSAANTALIAANAATVAADAAAIVTQGALAGSSVDAVIVADGQAEVSGTVAGIGDGVVTIDTDANADFASQTGLILTEVLALNGPATMVPVAQTGAVTAAEIAFVEAQQALFTDFVAAYNDDRTADLAAAAALTAEEAANEAVQALDPSAPNITLAATLATALAAAKAGDTENDGGTAVTVTGSTIVVAADGGITATVEGVANASVATNIAGTITIDAAFTTPDAVITALIAASQALEDGQNDLLQLSPLADTLATAVAGVVAAELTISTLADAADALAASTVINDTVVALELAASEAATALVGEQELIDAPGITLGANTIAMISNLIATDVATVTDFNVATDSLFFGDTYTVNTGELTTGNNAVLEMFITEGTTAADSLITFETSAFGSDSVSDFFTVELTGVAVDDIAITSGLIVGA